MLTRRHFFATTSASLASAFLAPAAPAPAIRRRDECFFGLHFDLHPNQFDTILGRDVTDRMVDELIDQAKPDYIQYDCKGHVGYMGYASEISTPSPGIVKDSLEVYRRVTAARGVALYIHFSGVQDGVAAQQHPEWARLDPDGKPDTRWTSTFSPYVDLRMIPQLKEAVHKYDLNGAWVDGECWGTRPDYCPAAAAAFTRRTGFTTLPKGPNEPGWLEFLELNRQQFRNYVRHWVDAMHAYKPEFQVTSNWIYSICVPEKPEIAVDYLSGDIYGNAVLPKMARLHARYFGAVGKPWDLMLWGFQHPAAGFTVGPLHKPSIQLQQESAPILAQGGGFQLYYGPTRAGKIDRHVIDTIADVSQFCRSRQSVSHKTETVAQVAVLFSRHSLYTTSNQLFGGWGEHLNPLSGMVDALIENHYSVDIVPDWKLSESAGKYPLIVVPDWVNIGGSARQLLIDRAKAGGKLLLVGAENAALFSGELGVRFSANPVQQSAFVLGDEVFADLEGLWRNVEPAGAQVMEQYYPTFDSTRDGKPAATLNSLGSGTVAAIYGPLGAMYAATHAPALRQFLRRIVNRLFTPMIELNAPPTVEVALRRKHGSLLVHLCNCTGMQVGSEFALIDYVPPVGPIEIQLRIAAPPKRTTLEPGGHPIAGSWRDGVWKAQLERLDVHAVVEVQA